MNSWNTVYRRLQFPDEHAAKDATLWAGKYEKAKEAALAVSRLPWLRQEDIVCDIVALIFYYVINVFYRASRFISLSSLSA